MTTTSTINVESLTKQINAHGTQKKKSELSARQMHMKDLISKVRYINAHFLKDAIKLNQLCQAMKDNNLGAFGEMMDSYGFKWEFMANGIDHKLGFILYTGNEIAIGCLGGGWNADTSAIIGLHGNKLMWGDENGNAKGDMIAMLSNPKYLNEEYAGIIKHFEDRINTVYNGFTKLRSDYLAYIEKQLNK